MAAPDYGTVVNQLAAKIAGVTNIANIYAQELYAANKNDFLEKFKAVFGLSEPIVQGWWFCMKTTETSIEEFDAVTYTYPIKLYGMLSINTDNNSEARMMALINGIVSAINANPRLTMTGHYDTDPVQLVSMDDMVYGSGGAVHFAELSIRVTFKA